MKGAKMINVVSLNGYISRKQEIVENQDTYKLVFDNVIYRVSLIDNGETPPDLPPELVDFGSFFDLTGVVKYNFGEKQYKKEYEQFADAVDKYLCDPATEPAFKDVYLAKDEDDDDDGGQEAMFEAMGYRLNLKAVMDHIVGKKEDWEAVENFRKFYKEWE